MTIRKQCADVKVVTQRGANYLAGCEVHSRCSHHCHWQQFSEKKLYNPTVQCAKQQTQLVESNR